MRAGRLELLDPVAVEELITLTVETLGRLPIRGYLRVPADRNSYDLSERSCDEILAPSEVPEAVGYEVEAAELQGPSAQLFAASAPRYLIGQIDCYWIWSSPRSSAKRHPEYSGSEAMTSSSLADTPA